MNHRTRYGGPVNLNFSVEHAFALPRSVMLWGYARAGIFLLSCYAYVEFSRSDQPFLDGPWSFAVVLIAYLGVGWWGWRYKWVRLSESGIRGCPIGSIETQSIAWSEPVLVEKASQPFLKGHTFISRATGSKVFIPLPILRLQAFQRVVEQQAPPDHVLRAAKF